MLTTDIEERQRQRRSGDCATSSSCYASAKMLSRLLGGLWRYLPGWLRRRAARVGQNRFTVTVGAFIFDDHGRILLLDHVFRPDDGWGVPGGFMSNTEQPDAALRRELREEIGIELTDVQLLFIRTLPKTRQVEIYFRAAANGRPEPHSFEIKSADWFCLTDLPPTLSKDQRRLIERATTIGEKSSV
jgi:ADP-ribose pyrophosphatase YjhB (NUDIX family)